MLGNDCFLIQVWMECNPEEPEITAGGGVSEGASCSARKKSLLEARAAQRRRSGSQGPIAEESSHRASPLDSAHGLLEIFLSLRWSNRPISRLAFRSTNRLLRGPSGSRKCGREWGLFAHAPAGSISSMIFFRAMRPRLWKKPSLVSWSARARNSRTHPAPPPVAASGPGASPFGFA
jgi:hypothetical protein